MKKQKESHERLFLLLGVLVAFVAVSLFAIGLQQRSLSTVPYGNNDAVSPKPSNSPKTYYSKALKVSFLIPSTLIINTRVNLISLNNDQGKISINKISTNYENLDEYLNDKNIFNNAVITNKKSFVNNNIPTISLMIGYPVSNQQTEKTYFLYPAPWTIYSLSTTSPALYDDLDTVARSFKYTP